MKDACKYLKHHCKCNAIFQFLFQDLIIFPDDIEYKRVKQCTTGRVYILKFKSSTRKFFFWMQEPKTDKDEEYMTKVNNLLNNPPTPGSGGGGSGLPPALAGLTEQLGKFDQAYGECHILITYLPWALYAALLNTRYWQQFEEACTSQMPWQPQ